VQPSLLHPDVAKANAAGVLFESLQAACTRAMHFADIVECFGEWAAEYRNSEDPKLTSALSQIDEWFVDCEKRLSVA
ncbi:unnamed protein product, partial [Durusdinium trenchii]